MEKLPLVRDHMDTEVCVLAPETEILNAVGLLVEHQVTGAPVIDGAGHLVGMLTEKDCLRLVATGAGADRPSGTVADFMTTDVTTIPPGMDVYYAAGLFLHQPFRRFPVVEDGKLVGAITRFDILRVIHAKLH